MRRMRTNFMRWDLYRKEVSLGYVLYSRGSWYANVSNTDLGVFKTRLGAMRAVRRAAV